MNSEEEVLREITENILPMAAVVGLLVGFGFTYEALSWLQNDVGIVVAAAANSVLGPLSPAFAAFLIVSRISATQAIGVFLGDVPNREWYRRNLIVALGGFAACSLFQISAIIGHAAAAEAKLPGSSSTVLSTLLLERAPFDWLVDNLFAAVMGFLISGASIRAAVFSASTDKRKGAAAASRSVSWGIMIICLCETFYWTFRSALAL